MRLWLDLHRGRSVGGFGLAPLSWGEFAAYCAVTGERFDRMDIHIVRLIEDEFFASRADASEREEKRNSKPGR